MHERILTNGQKAVVEAFHSHLRGISRFQGWSERQRECERHFREAIMSNPNVTKEDLVDFIKENAFIWDLDAETVASGGPIPMD